MPKRCFICGEENPVVLEEHHIIPQRLGGSDRPDNLATLCANCHTALEKIYDKRFWDTIPRHIEGASYINPDQVDTQLAYRAIAKLNNEITSRLPVESPVLKESAYDVLDLYDFVCRNRREALAMQKGVLHTLSEIHETLDEMEDSLDGRCVECGQSLSENVEVAQSEVPETVPDWSGIEVLCTECRAF